MPRIATALTLTGVRPASDAALRPASTSASRSRRVSWVKVSESIVSRLTLTRSRPAVLEPDGDPLEADAVRRHRDLRSRLERGDAGDEVDERAAQQRLASGEAHLRDAVAHEEADDPQHLLVRQHLGLRHPRQALGGHAVGAAQVAAVGDRHAQVAGHPPELVGQPGRSHARVGKAGHALHSRPGTVELCFDSG